MVGHFPSAVIHPIGLRIGLDVLLMISIDIILIVCYEKYQDIHSIATGSTVYGYLWMFSIVLVMNGYEKYQELKFM